MVDSFTDDDDDDDVMHDLLHVIESQYCDDVQILLQFCRCWQIFYFFRCPGIQISFSEFGANIRNRTPIHLDRIDNQLAWLCKKIIGAKIS